LLAHGSGRRGARDDLYESAVSERIEGLEEREAALRQRLTSDDGVVEWLRELGEERVEHAAHMLGWIDEAAGDEADVGAVA
jgi:hypothetical protein